MAPVPREIATSSPSLNRYLARQSWLTILAHNCPTMLRFPYIRSPAESSLRSIVQNTASQCRFFSVVQFPAGKKILGQVIVLLSTRF
jgi:hypothetical protein